MGSLKLDQFKLKNKLGTENAAGDELTDLEFLSSEFLQNLINSFLQNGFPIPLPEGRIFFLKLLAFFPFHPSVQRKFLF